MFCQPECFRWQRSIDVEKCTSVFSVFGLVLREVLLPCLELLIRAKRADFLKSFLYFYTAASFAVGSVSGQSLECIPIRTDTESVILFRRFNQSLLGTCCTADCVSRRTGASKTLSLSSSRQMLRFSSKPDFFFLTVLLGILCVFLGLLHVRMSSPFVKNTPLGFERFHLPFSFLSEKFTLRSMQRVSSRLL